MAAIKSSSLVCLASNFFQSSFSIISGSARNGMLQKG